MRAHIRRRPLLFVVLGLGVLAAGGASAEYARLQWSSVSAAAVGAEIALALRADSTAGTLDAGAAEVYGALGERPVWFAPEAREAAVALLARADRDALALDPDLDRLVALADTAATAESQARLDVDLTAALVRFGHALRTPRADAAELYGHDWTPVPPDSVAAGLALADALADARRQRDGEADPTPAALGAWADALRPQHPGYRRLRDRLARELDLAALVLDRDLRPGDAGDAVVTLRDRLALDGIAPAADDPAAYDDALAEAVRSVQLENAAPATGRLDAATRAALNTHRPELVPLLALNLERWRWLPDDLGDLHLWVNVPRYELALRERDGDDWAEAIRFVTVVGARDWETPSFTDTLKHVVFNPTWTVPASIQRESYGRVRGRVVRPPGPGNAMGRVKFLFPNAHSIYVHDTPSKYAFEFSDRARSHGCVRAGDPEGLARELLARTNGWEPGRVRDIFTGSWRHSQWVNVEKTVPVHLTYLTAEVDPDGRLRVFADVYGRDARLAEALGMDLAEVAPDVVASLIADAIGDERAVAEADAAAAEAAEAEAAALAEEDEPVAAE